jgi:hypothetical protein
LIPWFKIRRGASVTSHGPWRTTLGTNNIAIQGKDDGLCGSRCICHNGPSTSGITGQREYGSVNERWADKRVGGRVYELELSDLLRLGLIDDDGPESQ